MALGVVGLIYRLGLRYRTRVSSDGADATLAGEQERSQAKENSYPALNDRIFNGLDVDVCELVRGTK